jgi:hypothetical protein
MSNATNRNNKTPLVSFEVVLSLTKPPVGIGKLLQAYRPVGDLPPIPFDVVEMSAVSFEPIEKHEAESEIYDSIHGSGAMSKYLKSVSEGFVNYEEIVRFRDAEFNIYFREDHSIAWQALSIEHVLDREAAEVLFEAGIAHENRMSKEFPRSRVECEFGTLFARSDEDEIRLSIFRNEWDREHAEIKFHQGYRSDAFFLSDEWRILGSKPSIEKFLESSDGGNINSALALIQRLPECPRTPFRIRFFGSGYWRPEKFEKHRVKQKFQDGETDRLRFWDSKPDEFGIRLKVESDDDTRAVMASLATRIFADNFGNIITVHSMESGNLRIFGAIYPAQSLKKSAE